MYRTKHIHYVTPSGIDVFAHHTTGLKDSHPWLSTASATARTDPAPDHAFVASVEADITKYGRRWRLVWRGRNERSQVETHPTLDAALRRMGVIAVATHAIEAERIDFGPGPYGCL